MTNLSEQVVTCPALIGRTSQLESINFLLDQVRQARGPASTDQPGPGYILLIAREAGMGKSRLAAETKALLAGRCWRILQGHCFDAERHLPYAPIIDVFHTIQLPHSYQPYSLMLYRQVTAQLPIAPMLRPP